MQPPQMLAQPAPQAVPLQHSPRPMVPQQMAAPMRMQRVSASATFSQGPGPASVMMLPVQPTPRSSFSRPAERTNSLLPGSASQPVLVDAASPPQLSVVPSATASLSHLPTLQQQPTACAAQPTRLQPSQVQQLLAQRLQQSPVEWHAAHTAAPPALNQQVQQAAAQPSSRTQTPAQVFRQDQPQQQQLVASLGTPSPRQSLSPIQNQRSGSAMLPTTASGSFLPQQQQQLQPWQWSRSQPQLQTVQGQGLATGLQPQQQQPQQLQQLQQPQQLQQQQGQQRSASPQLRQQVVLPQQAAWFPPMTQRSTSTSSGWQAPTFGTQAPGEISATEASVPTSHAPPLSPSSVRSALPPSVGGASAFSTVASPSIGGGDGGAGGGSGCVVGGSTTPNFESQAPGAASVAVSEAPQAPLVTTSGEPPATARKGRRPSEDKGDKGDPFVGCSELGGGTLTSQPTQMSRRAASALEKHVQKQRVARETKKRDVNSLRVSSSRVEGWDDPWRDTSGFTRSSRAVIPMAGCRPEGRSQSRHCSPATSPRRHSPSRSTVNQGTKGSRLPGEVLSQCRSASRRRRAGPPQASPRVLEPTKADIVRADISTSAGSGSDLRTDTSASVSEVGGGLIAAVSA